MLQCCKNQTKPAGSSGSINSHKSRQEGRTGKLRLCPQEERRDSKFFGEGRGNTLLPPSINKQAVTLENKTPYVSYWAHESPVWQQQSATEGQKHKYNWHFQWLQDTGLRKSSQTSYQQQKEGEDRENSFNLGAIKKTQTSGKQNNSSLATSQIGNL